MAQPGDGGQGYSWFAVELTSADVEPGVFPWPEQPLPIVVSGGPVPDSSQMVQAGPGYLHDTFAAEFELVKPTAAIITSEELHPGELALWKATEDRHEVALELSNYLLTVRRDDEEFMLLFS